MNQVLITATDTGFVLPGAKGSIIFDQVVYRYQAEQKPVINKVSFTVIPGMTVALVGLSGSGKSTLSKLIQGIYKPESGRILINGLETNDLRLQTLHHQTAIAMQEDFLLNASVIDGITHGDPTIPREQVIKAAQRAEVHQFIMELPQGYDTQIRECATTLSCRQRQLLSLVRLFLASAPILILDEATSALDQETEHKILQNLQTVKGDRTRLIITHRFAPLEQADLILVLEKGMLIEQGTHAELMQQKGAYWVMYQHQQIII